MKITLEELTKRIESEDYIQDLAEIKYADLSKASTKKIINKLIKEVLAALKHNSLAHVELDVSGRRSAKFILETTVINLPFANYKKIGNFLDEKEDYNVNIYLEVVSDYINVSKFRIDLFASAEETDETLLSQRLANLIDQKYEEIKNFVKVEKSSKKSK
ncbi:hypothetical protein [Lactobacillus psittaci]|uniref:Uncharacterized protein n=1 Tax=Lactobacillus psittaci DSM 15354 TaxID=1122152 RepID=A0A0R1S2R4_9LACO|nr:hypothetical protein [Lactobacillus psittaci]KRL63360.1 hypothetical protein FC23_GL000930 [Lactobacillus psittaci DSM 15354]